MTEDAGNVSQVTLGEPAPARDPVLDSLTRIEGHLKTISCAATLFIITVVLGTILGVLGWVLGLMSGTLF